MTSPMRPNAPCEEHEKKDYERDDDHLVEQALMRTLKRASFRIWERRPIVSATVMRV